jgi:small subunit ribosomal protein S19e
MTLTNVKDVDAHPLILKIAEDLKENQGVKMPEFAVFVKTGSHKERAPEDKDWWFIRMASILRKVYVSGTVTVKSLRSYYGGKKRRGVRPSKFRKAGGKIIRVCLQDLEKLGFVKQTELKGRQITPKGQAHLDKMATQLFKDVNKNKKEIAKTETPKPEIAKKEIAKKETPKKEIPKKEIVKKEIPKTETIKTETPKDVEKPKESVSVDKK